MCVENSITACENNNGMMTFELEAHVEKDVERQVVELIARKKKLDPARISPASTFEELGLDSLDAADLIFTIEDTFSIVVSDEVVQSMKSVGQVIASIERLVAERAGAS